MRTTGRILALAALSTLTLLAACSSQKVPAEQDVARLEATLDSLRADARQHAAAQLQSAEASVNRLKEFLDKGDYEAVARSVPRVTAELETLRGATEAAKTEAAAVLAEAQSEWNELSESVPTLVEKLQARVDGLAKSRKYPKGMNKVEFEAAKSELESIKSEWLEAGDEFAAGLPGDAVRKGRHAKAMAEELIQQLEIRA